MLIVAYSSPLVALTLCGGLDLLEQLFDKIKVPQAVYDEVIIKGKPAADELVTYLGILHFPVDTFRTIWFPGKRRLRAPAWEPGTL